MGTYSSTKKIEVLARCGLGWSERAQRENFSDFRSTVQYFSILRRLIKRVISLQDIARKNRKLKNPVRLTFFSGGSENFPGHSEIFLDVQKFFCTFRIFSEALKVKEKIFLYL